MRTLRQADGIKHDCYNFSGYISALDKWSDYMQMHLYERHWNVSEQGMTMNQIKLKLCVCVCVRSSMQTGTSQDYESA